MTTILLCLFFCHFLADYTHLSTALMLNAKRFGKPIAPIMLHGYVHASLMGIVLAFYINGNWDLWGRIFVFQFLSHTLIDIWKGRMNGWFPSLQNPANKWHWIIFGIDQYFHAVVIILMVYYIQI